MKSIILTDEQHELLKQSVILQIRSLKVDIKHYRCNRDDFEKCGRFQEASKCSSILDSMYKKQEEYYDILFKLAQS